MKVPQNASEAIYESKIQNFSGVACYPQVLYLRMHQEHLTVAPRYHVRRDAYSTPLSHFLDEGLTGKEQIIR